MNEQNEIVSLIQTLGTSFRILPDRIPDRLNALSEEQRKTLLELLKRVADGGAPAADDHRNENRADASQHVYPAAGNGEPEQKVRKTAAKLPEPDTYDAVSDRSAICRGCPSGCELRWDDKGGFSGYSCIIGQETAEMLAEYYREE